MMIKQAYFLMGFLLVSCLACGRGSDANEGNGSEENAKLEIDIPISKPASTVVAWVDYLNVRKEPSTKGEVVAQVRQNEQMTLTGNKSDFTETITLRGNNYTTPWVEVETADGKTGWVFQGAVKISSLEAGSKLSKGNTIDLIDFGLKDLASWTQLFQLDNSGEEVDVYESLYQSDDQLYIQYIKSDRGEFYFKRVFRLYDSHFNLLKQKELQWDADSKELQEVVVNFELSPTVILSRLETRASMPFDNRPESAKGSFTFIDLPKAKEKDLLEKAIVIQPMDQWTDAVNKQDGCSCSFRSIVDNWKHNVFASDMAKQNACVKINGKLLDLKAKPGTANFPLDLSFANKDYEVWIKAEVAGKNDSGGDTYEGRMIVRSSSGNFLAEQNIWGDCNC